MTHLEIELAIDKLQAAVAARLAAEELKATVTEDDVRELEEDVCIQSRALFSRYVDTAQWEGVDSEETSAVGNALRDAQQCLKSDQACMVSVQHRAKDFEEFSKHGELKEGEWEALKAVVAGIE